MNGSRFTTDNYASRQHWSTTELKPPKIAKKKRNKELKSDVGKQQQKENTFPSHFLKQVTERLGSDVPVRWCTSRE